ncbi:FHA domain-containing protein [Microbacterium sp. VKM Ac-2870]|uniref:DUF5684 domain-containing protein n=1 Tax=Microbacterium sp. VKM Ac-2870 TaxID=2783825 RepID=UPI00188CF231|nr:DUF5684 domain-containing protein [Microbacterium sp. VKM Ac-2870]MBF4561389.1 FHA domain-containing protein [Microbacterium sp. VKM Ac-2870]
MNAPIGDSVGALLGLVALGVSLALYIWTALALAAVFRKMGESSWKGWIPFLNIATVLAWGGFSPWILLLLLLPGLGAIAVWVLLIVAAHRINPGFGYGSGMTVLAALLFVVWASILGFGPSRWLGARPAGGAARPDSERRPATLGGVFAREEEPRDPVVVSVVPAGPFVPGTPVAPAIAADSAVSPDGDAAGADRTPVDADDDILRLFAPPAPVAAPTWTPPQTTVPPASAPARGSVVVPPAAAERPAVAAEPEIAPPVARPPAAAPVSAAAVAAGDVDDREEKPDDDAAWPSEIDDVSAIAPSPFPPSSGAGWRHAMPPVTDDAPIDFVPGRRSTAEPAQATGSDSVQRVSAAAAAADAAARPAVPEPTPARRAEPAPARRAEPTEDSMSPEEATPFEAAAGPVPSEPELRRARPWPAFAVAPHEPDGFPELSGEVSAVIGSPAAGSPRSAAGSVAAQQRRNDPSGDDDIDQTVITRRAKKPVWQLVPASAPPVPITADVVILGRRPVGDAAFPGAQLVAVPGEALTVSKTHARLERRDDVWTITDLASTNGVLVRTLMGEEVEVEPGSKIDAGERFFLGDEEFHLQRIER